MNPPVTFVHLSDIHFGQETGGRVFTHADVRDRLVDDVAAFFTQRRKSGGHPATGVIITGDIAYGGKKPQYADAGRCLDKLTAAAGCQHTHVRVVPGNHDVDLDKVTQGTRRILEAIVKHGEAELDEQLKDEQDRELFYTRFAEYRIFSDGYGCPLSDEGGHAGEKTFQLAPGRSISMLGLNSALLCSGADSKGKLLLGSRQRTIPIRPGVEHVVLTHHPPPWLSDSADLMRFLKSRARVLLSGHEHEPNIVYETLDGGKAHFVHMEAGAATPPTGYEYTYAIIDFEWDEANDGITLTVHARMWNDHTKRFDADARRLSAGQTSAAYPLACPYFRASPIPAVTPAASHAPVSPAAPAAPAAPMNVPAAVTTAAAHSRASAASPSAAPALVPVEDAVPIDDDRFPALRLRFFRELDATQRLSILVELKGLPGDMHSFPTMSLERHALERIRAEGRLAALEAAIDRYKNPK